MKNKIINKAQNFSQILIKPIMFMSLAGLLISVSALLKAQFMPDFLQSLGDFIFNILSDGFIGQLSIIFCISIGTALSKENKTDAAILSLLTYFLFIVANNQWLTLTDQLAKSGEFGLAGTGQTFVLGFQVTDLGVFLGIILGLLSAYLNNSFSHITFSPMFSVFEGTRFVYFISIFIVSGLAILSSYIWPFFNQAIASLVNLISRTGSFGFFLYGFFNRMLLPLGLHSLLYMPILFSPLGGSATVAGSTYHGALNIWLAEIGNIQHVSSIHPSVGYLANFGTMALPVGIALALISTAKEENKSKVKAMLIPALFAALFAEITEPIEFMFLFSAPILWFAHAVVYGFGLFLASVLGLKMEVSTIIKTLVNAFLVPMNLGKQWLVPIIFIVLVAIEFFVFRFFILKLDLPTLGRKSKQNKPDSAHSYDDKNIYSNLIQSLGGKDNIIQINNCISRLRIDVKNHEKINIDEVKKFANMGVISKGNHIQIIIGPGVEQAAIKLKKHLY